MKRLILVIVFVLYLIGLSLIGEHTSWADKFAVDNFNCLGEDPDEPDPESEFIEGASIYLSEDPDEPDPESELVEGAPIYLSQDPDEPDSESELSEGTSIYLCEEPDGADIESEFIDDESIYLCEEPDPESEFVGVEFTYIS